VDLSRDRETPVNAFTDPPQHPPNRERPLEDDIESRETAAIRASENRLRSIIEAIDEAYFLAEMIVDADGNAVDYRLIETNAAFERMTGLSRADGSTALELVPDLEQYWIDTYAKVALTGEPAVVDHWSEGLGRWFEGSAVAAGEPGRFAVLFKDQTERRAEDESIRRSEHRFRTMVDALPLMVWEHSPDGAQTWVSNTFCEYFGTTRDDMHADRWQMLTHPDDRERYAQAFAAAIDEERSFRARVRVRNAAGEWRWLDSWGQPRFDDAGTFTGMVGTSADVTDLVESQRRVRDSETFTRRVLDNLFTFVGVLAPDGTLLIVNRAPLALAELRAADVLGRPFWDTPWWNHSTHARQRLEDSVTRALDGETVRYDTKVAARDGTTIWIDFQLAPLWDRSGRISHLIASGYDVTSRYAAEQRLAESLENERRARERIELLERTATHLAAATTRTEIAEVLLCDLEKFLAVDVAALDVVEGDHVVTLLSSGITRSDHQPVTIRDVLPGPSAIAANAPVICNTEEEMATRFPRLASVTAKHPVRTIGALPLRNGARTALGALVVTAEEPGWMDESMVSLLTSIASQAGQALDRARLHEQALETSRRDHNIALQLQRALLPSRLVEHPRVEIAATYSAASDVLAVGGDWYDTHLWDDRYLGVTVGDVVGHDLDATITMGRVRIASGALMTFTEPDPAAILRVHHHCASDYGTFATAVSVVLDVETGQLRYCLAGHPPQLVVGGGGSITWLADDPAPPLGVWPDELQPPVGSATLTPGAVLLLYSDGLVERRGCSIDDGLQQLSAVAGQIATAERSTGEIIELILAELTDDSGIDDDIILTCIRWRPETRG
jgi:PAS domain S-box-containing protein